MGFFDKFNGKAALDDSQRYLEALETGMLDTRNQLEAMPPFVPTGDRQTAYAENNLISDGNGGFYSPERAMMLDRINQADAMKQHQKEIYERKRTNPLFNIADLGADAFRNTVGLIPNLLSGGTAVTADPSRKLDSGYRQALSNLTATQDKAMQDLINARKDRATAFAGGISKTIGTAVPNSRGGLSIPVQTGDGGVSMHDINNPDGTIFDNARMRPVDMGGGQIGYINEANIAEGISKVTDDDVMSRNNEAIESGAAAEIKGKATGEAVVALGQYRKTIEQYRGSIQSLKNHRGLKKVVGKQFSGLTALVAGSDEADFMSALDQVRGQLFMQAREPMKGGGSITDFEGLKGEQAISNLNTAQSSEQFIKALEELDALLQDSLRIKTSEAGGDFNITPRGTRYRIISEQ